MICHQCKQLDLKSRVYRGSSSVTLRVAHQFYDEDGKEHYHNPNVRTTAFHCSNGHSWIEKESKTKCWCGWEGS